MKIEPNFHQIAVPTRSMHDREITDNSDTPVTAIAIQTLKSLINQSSSASLVGRVHFPES